MMTCFQIYYSVETAQNCFPESSWWKHWDNINKLTPFFENSCIKEIVSSGWANSAKYLGIFSHDIKQEISFKENNKLFSPETLREEVLNGGVDFYSFQKRRTQPNIITQAEHYHKGIVEMTTKILKAIGYNLPKKLDRIVLFNHFVARVEVYEKYVEEMLIPAMDVMTTMPELNGDAGYKREHPDFTSQLGFNHYPFHPFILERLPSVWLQYNPQVTFKHIF